VAGPAWIAVTAIAARWRGWRVADYLALVTPRGSEFAFGFACMAALLTTFDVLTYAIGRDLVPTFMFESYKTAQSSGHAGAVLHRRRDHRTGHRGNRVPADSCFVV